MLTLCVYAFLFGKCLFIVLPKSSSWSPSFHACMSWNSDRSWKKERKEKTIIIYWNNVSLFLPRSRFMQWKFIVVLFAVFLEFSSASPNKVFKGIYDKSCITATKTVYNVFWHCRMRNYGLTIDKKSHKRCLGHLKAWILRSVSVCVVFGAEKAFEREERTFQNCPKWPWFFILVFTSCSTRIIFYRIFYCYFYSSHLHTFFPPLSLSLSLVFVGSSVYFVLAVLFSQRLVFFCWLDDFFSCCCVYECLMAWRIKCETRKHKNSYYQVT